VDAPVKVSFPYGKHTVTFEVGRIARQATAAVLVEMDGTSVLVTVVSNQSDTAYENDFFPLIVEYQERDYAAGKIPGGYFRREGRPSEHATLTARLIDRPIHPLFPKGFKDKVQVIATVLSVNPEVEPDIPALLGASAALSISGIPFNGPLGAARVGYVDGQLVLNPSISELAQSQLDLVVAGTQSAVLMVESEAAELPEEVMLNAVDMGHQSMQVVIQAIVELHHKVGKPRWNWQPLPVDEKLEAAVKDLISAELTQAYTIQDKLARQDAISALKQKVVQHWCSDDMTDPEYFPDEITEVFSSLEKRIVRQQILDKQPRIDGRDSTTVRPINVEVGVLPRVHGSALFTRGETQALVVTTLGSSRDAQSIDSLNGERTEHFLLHYNFPPYSVGETGMIGSPKRREIGHGRLAKRGMQAVMPSTDEFPYVIRIVSEVTESNGSSSMASVCGSSLSLMDAGVPVKAPVAGIAMGLVMEDDRFTVLTDILGDEDHLGDMDFKVTGTEQGVTALQMDIKIQGITREIMEQALAQARDGRLHILGIMNQVIATPRTEVSDYAPRITTIQINPDKIRDVIGKGGATIRSITESTGVTIDITDDGIVRIAAVDVEAAKAAQQQIELLTVELEIGQMYQGKVIKIMAFGAFVHILPGKDGLVHVSQIADERVEDVHSVLSEGQEVKVKVLEIDRQGKIRLSMKEV